MTRNTILSYLRVTALGFCLLFSTAAASYAQEEGQESNNKPDVRLTREQLHLLEGYFQNPENSDLTVQFTADSTTLLAKLLWNGGQLRLHPTSPLEFHSNEGERVSITFIKDPDGRINGMSLRDNPPWKRIYNYHPLVRTEIPHSPGQLKPYEGLYQLQGDPDQYILLAEKDNKLILHQLWDGQDVSFVPDSAWDFYCKDLLIFTLHFTRDSSGAVSKVLAFKRDTWIIQKKASYAPADLKVFEGKYQLTVDSDDVILITASGNNLEMKQLWDGKTVIVSPLADCYFYNAEKGFPMKFKRGADGNIAQVVALNGDVFERVKP